MTDMQVELLINAEWRAVKSISPAPYDADAETAFEPVRTTDERHGWTLHQKIEECVKSGSPLWVRTDADDVLFGPGAAGPFLVARVQEIDGDQQ